SVQVTTQFDEMDGWLTDEAQTNIYRIVQEALNNVVKHADATEARVALRHSGSELILAITDNGKGISKSSNGERNGFGLVGIAERARLLGGSCVIDSRDGEGTTLKVVLTLVNGDK